MHGISLLTCQSLHKKIYQFFSDVICDSDSPWQFSIRPMSPFSSANSSTAVPTRNTCYSFSLFPSLSPSFFLLTGVFRAVFIFKDTISQEPPLTHFTFSSCCNRISANIVLCLTHSATETAHRLRVAEQTPVRFVLQDKLRGERQTVFFHAKYFIKSLWPLSKTSLLRVVLLFDSMLFISRALEARVGLTFERTEWGGRLKSSLSVLTACCR